MKSPLFVVGLLVCGCAVAFADDAGAPDKSGYTLFNPTPSDSLRPLRVQSYDNVTDPTTVDAGHFQVEGSLFNLYRIERHYTPSYGSYNFAETLYSWTPRFTAGLLNNLDLEVMPTYSVLSERDWGEFNGGVPVVGAFHGGFHSSGFGNVIVESKLNLWGNDGGCTALSISPVISIPTDRGDALVAFDAAFAWRLPMGFYLKLDSGVMQQQYNSRDGRNNYVGFFEGLSINKSIGSKWDVYTAVTAEVSSYSLNPWSGYAEFGAIYKVSRDFQLFGGMNFGLTDNSFDFNPRAGIAWRL